MVPHGGTPSRRTGGTYIAQTKPTSLAVGGGSRGFGVGRLQRSLHLRTAGWPLIYLSWGFVEEPGSFEMFRRAKIMFDGIPADMMTAAQESGVLIGRLGLTDPKGNPTCATVRPPLIEWTTNIR
jgi:hypothetical protein